MNVPNLVLDTIYLLALYKVVFFFVLSLIHFRKSQKITENENFRPFVSVIIPCYNEEATVINCLKSVLAESHKNIEIIVVNDGSTDKTSSVVKKFSLNQPGVTLYDKQNGGKAQALNFGIAKAKGEIIVCIDADSVLKADALTKLIRWFNDQKVGAVSGNVKVANKKNLLGLHQAGEYISGLNLQRRSFEILNALQVIPGAIGAFRKDVLEKVGGYSSDTKVEDMDITIAIQNAGYKVIYEPKAIAYTETPESLKDFIKQRHRWIYGSFRVIKKYKKLVLSRNGGTIGNIGLMYSLVFPFVDLVLSVLFISTSVKLILSSNFLALVQLVVVLALGHLFIIFYSLLIDKDNFEIAFVSVFMGIWYYHLISAITLMAVYSYVTSKKEEHVVFRRLGKNRINPVYS
jgi:poly-beta-1,6 N-acetyl-D-glucosamine synthase